MRLLHIKAAPQGPGVTPVSHKDRESERQSDMLQVTQRGPGFETRSTGFWNLTSPFRPTLRSCLGVILDSFGYKGQKHMKNDLSQEGNSSG